MRRCFDLARRGAGTASPNPLVGSVIVFEGRVIGEGCHVRYGEAHAERNAIRSVSTQDKHALPKSRLYVSLEPCCHYGRTPPCTDLILTTGIKEVFVSTHDPNPLVCGKGMEVLRANGIRVHDNILIAEGRDLIRYFETYMTRKRPHIILKFAQSHDGFIGKPDDQIWLSNDYERIMVHKLRSEVDAIMIGTNTAVIDNPELTTRYYPGRNPVRVLLDRTRRIPLTHQVLDGSTKTVLFSEVKSAEEVSYNIDYVQCLFDESLPERVLEELYHRKIQSLLIEGGAQLIKSFLRKHLWDEAIVVRTPKLLESGIKAPLIEGSLKWRYEVADDEVISIIP